jgi:hypothetical protein
MTQDVQKLEPLKAEIAEMVSPLLTVTVTDFKSCQDATNAAKTIKAMLKRLDDLRRAETDPLRARVSEIMDYVKSIQAPLDAADAHIRTELNRFAVEQEKIRQEELRKAQEEQRRKEAELAKKQAEEIAALEKGAEMFGDDGAIEELAKKQAEERAVAKAEIVQKTYDINQFQVKNTRKTVRVRVVDLKKVPKNFLIIEVNEKAAIAAHKAAVTIPGLEFYEELAVSIGQKTRVTKAALEG